MQRCAEAAEHRAGFAIVGFGFALEGDFHLVDHFLHALEIRLDETEIHDIHAHGGMNAFGMRLEIAAVFAG